MTDTQITQSPKQSSWKKKLFWIIALVLGALGLNHYTFKIGYGGANVEITITESTITSSVNVDTTITILKADTTKPDTTKNR